jgi:hypothetical protein
MASVRTPVRGSRSARLYSWRKPCLSTSMSITPSSLKATDLHKILPEPLRNQPQAQEAVERVRADFREMPGMSLTLEQGCRLWNLSPEICRPILEALVSQGSLKRIGAHYSLK